MASIDLLILGLTGGIALIFSLVAVMSEKTDFYYKLLAAVLWFIFAPTFFIIGHENTGLVVYPVTLLWVGLGLLFMFKGINDFFTLKKDKIWSFD